MKKFQRLLSLLLAMLLCFSLAGCPAPAGPTETTPNQPTSAPTTTPTDPDADALYDRAVAALEEQTYLRLDIEVKETLCVSGAEYAHDYEEILLFHGRGTDKPIISLEHKSFDSGSLGFTEYYADGTVYSQHGDMQYRSAVSQEEYMEQLLPVVLLDKSLYANTEVTENADGTILYRFSQPTAGESWAVPEDIAPEEAWGQATLNNQGQLTQMTCYIDFCVGNFRYVYEIATSYTYGAQELSHKAPTDPDSYIAIDSNLIPRLVSGAAFDLSRSEIITATAQRESYSQAAGVYFVEQQSHHGYFADSYRLAKADYQNQVQYYDGSQYTYSFQEEFKDGVYTYTEDGMTNQQRLSATQMLTYCRDAAAAHLLSLEDWITGATMTDLGSVYYMQFTATEDYGDKFRAAVSQLLFSNENHLEQFSTSYRTDKLELYMSVDKFTGLPVAAGYSFTGIHTIDGVQYQLVDNINCTMILSSADTYESITDQPLPDEEPESKPTPLFYKVTGPDGQEMWLFGTIHVGDARTAYLPQEIFDALEAADALAVEFDMDAFEEKMEADPEFQQQVYKLYMYPNNGSILAHVSGKVYKSAKQLLTAYGIYNPNMDYLKAAAWESSLSGCLRNYGYGLLSSKGVDYRLLRLAKAQNKPIYDIESGISQLSMMMGYSDELQEMLLSSALEGSTIGNAISLNELFALWCQGDEDALREALKDDLTDATEEELKLYEEYNKAMSTDRNAYMLQKAIEYLQSGETVFYAVGLAHLLVEDGLVNTLRDAGYTVELVSYS